MNKKRITFWVTAVILVASFVLAACGPTATSQSNDQAVNPASGSNSAVTTTTASCPTEKEFEQQFGVRADLVRTEPCAFHWRGDPDTITVNHPCPDGWSCTIGIADPRQTYQYKGDDSLQPMTIFAATWRLTGQYPVTDVVHDNCAMLAKVQHEGQISDPQWTALAGNFTCQ